MLFRLFIDNKNPGSQASKLRNKRFSIFLKILNVDHNTRILDVGGGINTWLGSGFEKNVTILNIDIDYNTSQGVKFV